MLSRTQLDLNAGFLQTSGQYSKSRNSLIGIGAYSGLIFRLDVTVHNKDGGTIWYAFELVRILKGLLFLYLSILC